MVAEILAGISLCNSAYKTIKESIANCKEVGQLAGSIDQLIEGKQQLDNAVKPTNRVASKWSRMMGAKGIDNEGSLSIGSIAQEKINQKLAAEELDKVRSMINRRFGFGTWEEIIMERDERLEKAKTQAQKNKDARNKKLDNYFEIAKNALIIFGVIIGMGVVWMFYTKQWTI